MKNSILHFFIVLRLPILIWVQCILGVSGLFGSVKSDSIFVYCGTGDHFWDYKKEPLDSKAAIISMLEWTSATYNAKRIYWRGGQEELMTQTFKFGKESVQHYDYYKWVGERYKENALNKTLIEEARKRGIQTFLHTGLFEHGVQPDIGIIAPYMFEDVLRITNSNWVPLNRWGNRRAPGMLSLAFPESRHAIRKRLINYVNKLGYDGINFYTYNENTGIRFEDEFGFEEPIMQRFRKKYPKADPRMNKLTQEQRFYWYKIKGEFLTIFLKEMHDDLKMYGKSLSIVLNPDDPTMPQPAWGKNLRSTGNIYFNWKKWIEDDVVDEIWVQSGALEKQITLLDDLVSSYNGKIKIIVRTNAPESARWKKYTEMGVVLVAVITNERNGIEKYSRPLKERELQPTPEWIHRINRLEYKTNDVTRASREAILLELLADSNVLVRRKALQEIGALDYVHFTKNVEQRLIDNELGVRLMAMATLVSLKSVKSIDKILDVFEKDSSFMAKNTGQELLSQFGPDVTSTIIKRLNSSKSLAIKEVCIRVLSSLGRERVDSNIAKQLLSVLNGTAHDYRLRWWALKGLVSMRFKMSDINFHLLTNSVISMIDNERNLPLYLEAVSSLESLSFKFDRQLRIKMISKLSSVLEQYGDNSVRVDSAYGWRVIGNTIMSLGPLGVKKLEDLSRQKHDRWLAWIAYEVLYTKQRKITANGGFNLIPESEEIINQNKFAPAFPGFRVWK